MGARLIDAEQLIQDLYSDYMDKDEFEYELIYKYLDKKSLMIDEDSAKNMLDDFLDGIVSVIETAETII